MTKLNDQQIVCLRSCWDRKVLVHVNNQLGSMIFEEFELRKLRDENYFSREDLENTVYQDDISDEYLEHIKNSYDTSDYDDTDLIEWIRDIQNEKIELMVQIQDCIRRGK